MILTSMWEFNIEPQIYEARGGGRAIAEIIMYLCSLTVLGWILLSLGILVCIGIYFFVKYKLKDFIQLQIRRHYRYKYGEYKFFIFQGFAPKWIPVVLLFALMPLLPNDYEEMFDRNVEPVNIIFWIISGFMVIGYMFSLKWISWKRGLEIPKLLVFYENYIEVYNYWGLKFDKAYTTDLVTDGNIENINPENDIDDKKRKKVELLTKEGNHIAYIVPIICISQTYNQAYEYLKNGSTGISVN